MADSLLAQAKAFCQSRDIAVTDSREHTQSLDIARPRT